MKKKICIYSACDRFNYGDLLFPMVLTNLLKQSFGDKYDIEIFGTIRSDLSSYGALKTKPIRQVFRQKYLVDGSVLIVGGGYVLPLSWKILNSYLDHWTADLVNGVEKIARLIHFSYMHKLCNMMSRQMLCPNLIYPFLISNSDFKSNVKVVYNTIGCTDIRELPRGEKDIMRKKLSKTSYISVRERSSLETLDKLDFQDTTINLAPDSAIMISEIFTKREILGLALSATRDFIQKNSNRYICFQISERQASGKYSLIAEQLQQISREHNMPILLLPIGYAKHHWDQKALELIKKEIKFPTIMPSHASVFDIMASIAFCRIFIGTSLHGAVTALSFGVPHLGVGPKGEKLDLFLNTWDIPEQAECASVTEFAQRVSSVMATSLEERNSKKDEMVCEYRQCFKNIVGTIES